MPNDEKKNKVGEEEWEFKISSNEEVEVPANSALKLKSKGLRAKTLQKKSGLTLDHNARPQTKSRTRLSSELDQRDEKKYKDLFHYASLSKRAMAFCIDLILLGGLLKGLQLLSPLLLAFFHSYSVNLPLGIRELFLAKIVLGLGGLLGGSVLFVIPLAFYNVSLGKKCMGLQVRGEELFTLSLFQAMGRELFLKPLSILLVFGFITPFFTKKRQSLHDMMANTIVIED
ncbi:MAG: RDD family protein [Bacteriovorax sp.]|nr:RDD family protein [Bacteriovorax sp.]